MIFFVLFKDTVNQLFCGYLFSHFCLHGNFCGDSEQCNVCLYGHFYGDLFLRISLSSENRENKSLVKIIWFTLCFHAFFMLL